MFRPVATRFSLISSCSIRQFHESNKFPSLDTKFNQYRIAYRYRRSLELLRGYLVYRIFSINFLVNNQTKLAKWGEKFLGRRLFKTTLKLTAFGHFVGGETAEEIQPVIERLQKYGVQPILDYSVESDDAHSTPSLNEIERIHEHNTNKFIECLETSRRVCGKTNLIAIKITALIRPNILKKFNQLIKSISDRSTLPSLIELINRENSEENFQNFFDKIQENVASTSKLTRDELTEVYQLVVRLNRIGKNCVENDLSIMVDAEQTYFQTAINYFATELQRFYNRNDRSVIYGTYQCYLKETFNSLKFDLNLAEKGQYVFAAKLVRGAYMEQERRLAHELGYDDPINADFQSTSKMYQNCFDEVLKSIQQRSQGQVRVMIASHNEETIRYAIEQMTNFQIRRDSSIISFASLYGMSDYVAFALAHSGYKTFKYLPYGPIEALQPYLFRRAQENRSIFEKADKDRRLHLKAFQDRLLKLRI